MKPVVLILILMLALLISGCASTSWDTAEGGREQLPWNTPAGWEGSIIGVPY